MKRNCNTPKNPRGPALLRRWFWGPNKDLYNIHKVFERVRCDSKFPYAPCMEYSSFIYIWLKQYDKWRSIFHTWSIWAYVFVVFFPTFPYRLWSLYEQLPGTCVEVSWEGRWWWIRGRTTWREGKPTQKRDEMMHGMMLLLLFFCEMNKTRVFLLITFKNWKCYGGGVIPRDPITSSEW